MTRLARCVIMTKTKQKPPSHPFACGLGLINVTGLFRRALYARFFVVYLYVYVDFKKCGGVSAITELMINEQIRDKEVRLIDNDGTQLGVMPLKDAVRLADEKKMDLAKISPTAKPPVCKIMDYSKFKFDQAKKEKEARKKQKTIDIKELRLSPNIDVHDVEVKLKKAIEFLKEGDKVKVTIRFRGRELGHTQIAYSILNDFASRVSEYGVVEHPPKMETKSMAMFLGPKG